MSGFHASGDDMQQRGLVCVAAGLCIGQQCMGLETGNGPPGLVRFWAGDLGELDFFERGIRAWIRKPKRKNKRQNANMTK